MARISKVEGLRPEGDSGIEGLGQGRSRSYQNGEGLSKRWHIFLYLVRITVQHLL